jgi:hypothetical protein
MAGTRAALYPESEGTTTSGIPVGPSSVVAELIYEGWPKVLREMCQESAPNARQPKGAEWEA